MFTVRKIEGSKRRRSPPMKSIIGWGAELSRPLLHWYEDWKERREKERRQEERVRMLKRVLIMLVSVFVAFLIIAGLAKALFSIQILNFSQLASITGSAPVADENGFTNILLMGQGNEDHDGKDLTDTIMLASIDTQNSKSAVLLSFPRDLYLLQTEKMGKGKLNTFYRDYKGYLKYMKDMSDEVAAEEALKEIGAEIGRHMELPIHGVIKVDFIAFTEAVDALGGVDIEVPYDIIDPEYPDENFGYDPFEIYKGPNHLDGATALKYVRSRHTTSDFDRSARQQQLLRALAQKAKEEGLVKNPGTLLSFLKIYNDNVETTLSTSEMIGLLALLKDLDKERVITMQLSDRNALYDSFIEPGGFLYTPPRELFDGASVLLPVSIPEFPVTWKQILALKQLLFHSRSVYLDNPTISVLNAGAASGIARKLANELTRYGFNVEVIENASLEKQEESFVATLKEEVEEVEETHDDLGLFFASLFKIKTLPMPSELSPEEVRSVTIVLGKDYSYRPLQSLISAE
ncbi:LCP family protein [Patescibacteria group bacterium]|nr:LCP family protein [Patescibacteria group bacterium]MBU2259025.1 LCP family protein [Patescibacteria group bacterium]